MAVRTQADDQCRQQAHHAGAGQAAAFLLVADLGQFRLDAGWQLQVVETEHRERQGDEDQGEHADRDRVLQHRLDVLAGQRGKHAGDRVGQRHRQHVHQRQHERLAGRDVPALARDDADRIGIIRNTQG